MRNRSQACDIVVPHCLQTRPDSFKARRKLFESLLALMPSHHPLRAEVACSLMYLVKHEEANEQLLLAFEQEAQRKKGPQR